MADFLASLPLGKLLPPGHHGFLGAAGIRLKTVAADACTLVAGRDLPAVIVKARDAFSVDLTDGPRRSAGAGIDFIGIGPGRWLAVLIGFAGVLIAATPSGGAPFEAIGLALLAAMLWACTTLLARSLAKGVSTPAMMLGGAIGFVLFCGAGLPFYGVIPTVRQAAEMAAIGCVGTLGQYFWFEGVRRAQASLLAPLEYSLLAYAIFWGYVFFGDLPSERTLIGASVILASGLAVMGLEIRRARIRIKATV